MSAKKKKGSGRERGSSKTCGQSGLEAVEEQFIGANVPQSQTPKKAGNLTGPARKVKDCCADLHNCISKWDAISSKGQEILSLVANIKLKTVFQDEAGDVPSERQQHTEDLQNLCEKLEKVYQSLEKIVQKMESISRALKGVHDLELHQSGQAESQNPLFLTWPTVQFYETAASLTAMYMKELDLRKTIIENVAHTAERDLMMFYTSSWVHQPYVDINAEFLLESCLVETGHR